MAISNINYSNTFGQWLISTNQTITEVNSLKTDNYTKTSGTLYLDSSSIGLSVSNNSLFSGNTTFSGGTAKNLSIYVPSYFYQPVTIASNTSITATGNIFCSYSFANNVVANTATITRLNSLTLASNTITSNIEFANTIFTNKIDANNIVYKGLYTVAFNGNFTTANNITVTGNFPLQINVSANSNITLPPGANTLVASGFISNADIIAGAGIVDTKLATIATAGKVSNSATTANSSNSSSTIVARDTTGSFSTRNINLTATTGTAPLTVSSTTLVTNLNADLLDGFNTNTANSSSTVAVRQADGSLEGRTLISTVATGVAPLAVTSNTLVTNLNADLLDGFNTNTANSSSTVAVRQADGSLEGNILKSTVATGTAPLTVASTTLVTNLNADLLDGFNTNTANSSSTVAVRQADGSLEGRTLISTVATGTAPLTVASTTLVTNLNADLLDGYHASTANSSSTVAVRQADGSLEGNILKSTVATGTAPLAVASTTLVTNLNADLLDGYHANTANSSSTVAVRQADGSLEGRTLISTVATGTAPLAVTSTTAVTNLNADLLDGYHVGTSGASIPLLNGINTWSGTQTVNASLIVSGDLTISGNTISSGATINDSGDYILRANTGSTSSPDSNFIIKRNSPASANANNATIRWDNTGLNWKLNDVTNNNFYNVLIDKPTQTVTGSWTFSSNVTLNNILVSSNTISGTRLFSTVATGTAPLAVTSNTLVTNLNADLLDGFNTNTANSSSTVAVRKTDGSLEGNILISTVATGTAPLTVSSTTLATNLNADLLDGYHANTANSSSTVAVRKTDGSLEGRTLISTVATGTAPLTVSSTTLVTNLNADLLDGFNTNTANSSSTVAVRQADGSLEGRTLISTVATGTAPLAVTSNTLVTNLNADLLDGYHVGTSGSAIPILSAQNTFANNTIFNVNSSNDAVRITQSGSGNALVVEDSANPDSTPFVIDASGKVIMGGTSGTYPLNLQNSNYAEAAFDSVLGSSLILRRAATSITLPTIVANGNFIGSITFSGYDGSAYRDAASIYTYIDNTPGTNDMPGRLVFSTTADGSASPTERMRITSDGNVLIGTTTDGGQKLQVNGSFTATTKSFLIDHPTKEGMKLRYGSLESPYHGVRLTGEGVIINRSCTIKLPDYIHGLCKQEGSNVQITNIKHGKILWVDNIDISNDEFTVQTDSDGEFAFYWSFTAIRKDVADMMVEY